MLAETGGGMSVGEIVRGGCPVEYIQGEMSGSHIRFLLAYSQIFTNKTVCMGRAAAGWGRAGL